MSPLNNFIYLSTDCGTTGAKGRAFPEVVSVCTGSSSAVLLRFFGSSGTISDSFWSGSGGTNLSQGDQAKVPALLYQVLLLENIVKILPEKKINICILKQLYNVLVSVSQEMI